MDLGVALGGKEVLDAIEGVAKRGQEGPKLVGNPPWFDRCVWLLDLLIHSCSDESWFRATSMGEL